MPNHFVGGETILCKRNVKDPDTGNYYDPATSMTITIDHALNGLEIDNVDMIKDTTGKYHYYYTLPDVHGIHKTTIEYKATDGSHITIWTEEITAR